MAIKWRAKILLAELETTYGVDPAPTGASDAVLATNVTIQPMEGDDRSRDLDLPWLGSQPTVATGLHARMAFRVELAPSGVAGTAPAWGPLLKACGVAETVLAATSVIYAPVSDPHPSLTLHFWIGGTRHVLRGARGTCTFRFTAQDIPYLEFQFWGLFSNPSEQARPAPVLGAFKRPEVATSARTPVFTIAGRSFVLRSLSLDIGNRVQPRILVGAESILIVDRAESLSCTVEAQPLTAFDPFAAAQSGAPVVVELVHGTLAGAVATLAAPAAQMLRPTGYEQQQMIAEWPLRLTPLPVSGDDQWSLKLT